MPGRILGRVGVVQIGDLLVPLRRPRAAQVWPWHEGTVAPHLELRLEGVGGVGLAHPRHDRRPVVDQKDRDRARPRRQVPFQILRRDRPLDDVELQAAGIGDILHQRCTRPRQRQGDHLLTRIPLPDRERLAIRADDLPLGIVAPAHRHRDGARGKGHQEAQAHRRGVDPLLRRLALLVRLLGEAPRLRDLAPQVVVLVGVRAPLWRRPRRDQEAGQIPVRGSHPAWQPLLGERAPGRGADQVELERLDQSLPHLQRVRRQSVLRSCRHEKSSPVSDSSGARLAAPLLPGFLAAAAPVRASSFARAALSSSSRARTSSRTSSGQR